MDIEVTGAAEVLIRGNIKSIEDYREIKRTVLGLVEKGARRLTVGIPDSLSMTSSVIGFFVKLTARDNVKVSMHVRDRRLYGILDELKLLEIFDVHMSEKAL